MGRCEPTMTEPTMIERNMAKIKHKILVLSGKGGVGKSTTCCNIAQCFVAQGLKVGVLDIDICGPSVPMLLGLEDREVMQSSDGWVPVFADQEQRLCCMSIGFLLKSRDAPVIFRCPTLLPQLMGVVPIHSAAASLALCLKSSMRHRSLLLVITPRLSLSQRLTLPQ